VIHLFSRRGVKKRKAKEILNKSKLKVDFDKIKTVKQASIIKIREINLLILNNIPLIFFNDDLNEFFPYVESYSYFKCPKIIVDRGAVAHILGGADVMAPGILSFDSFTKDDVVIVFGESISKAIAVGKALLSSSKLKSIRRGKVVKNLHHMGDKLWKTLKSLQI